MTAPQKEPAGSDLPKYSEWQYLRTHGQWSNGVPVWAKDHLGRMNDFSAAQAVIEELADRLRASQPSGAAGDVAAKVHDETSTIVHATLYAPMLQEFCLEASREDEGHNWYIEVTDESGYHTYDGFWRDSERKSCAEVLAEAAEGSLLHEISPPPEDARKVAPPARASLASPSSGGWISVDERLPPPFVDVLVYPRPTDYCCEAHHHKGVWKYGEYETHNGHVVTPCRVKYWQQIAPPATKSGDKSHE